MFLSASWEHLDSFVTPLDYSWRALSRLRSLQERPSLVKNNWETIKKPLRRCQEGPRSVQERARLIKESQIFWTCSTNFQKFLVLPTVQESSRSVKKCQELVTEVAKKYQDIYFGTLLVQIRIVGQGPYANSHAIPYEIYKAWTRFHAAIDNGRRVMSHFNSVLWANYVSDSSEIRH